MTTDFPDQLSELLGTFEDIGTSDLSFPQWMVDVGLILNPLQAMGDLVSNITAWGEPGFVDPYYGNGAGAWIAIDVSDGGETPRFSSDFTVGFGDFGESGGAYSELWSQISGGLVQATQEVYAEKFGEPTTHRADALLRAVVDTVQFLGETCDAHSYVAATANGSIPGATNAHAALAFLEGVGTVLDLHSVDGQAMPMIRLTDDSDTVVFSVGPHGNLMGIGNMVANVTAWGVPGFVDPVAADDSKGWIGLLANQNGADFVVGDGSSATHYAEMFASATDAAVDAHSANGARVRLITNDGYATIAAHGATDQVNPLIDVQDEHSDIAFRVAANGDTTIGDGVHRIGPSGIGFWNATMTAQAAHPATLQDVIDILTNLGLCAA